MIAAVIIACSFGLGAGIMGFTQMWDASVCEDPNEQKDETR
jgi:hypothetical protein